MGCQISNNVKFLWDIEYYDVLMGKLVILKVCMGTLEILPYFKSLYEAWICSNTELNLITTQKMNGWIWNFKDPTIR